MTAHTPPGSNVQIILMQQWRDVSGEPALHKSEVTLHNNASGSHERTDEQSKVYLYKNTQATLEDTTSVSPKHAHTIITYDTYRTHNLQ